MIIKGISYVLTSTKKDIHLLIAQEMYILLVNDKCCYKKGGS
jgi:hypothetical protein